MTCARALLIVACLLGAAHAATIQYVYDELQGTALGTVYHTGVMIDEVLARYAASGNRTLLSDALMSVIAQTDDEQAIANFYAYSAYGEAAALGPDGDNPLQYTGRENDGTGLYYYRARYFDSALSRFISEDPIGIDGGLNLYAYVGGNPIEFADPEGLLMTWVTATQRQDSDMSAGLPGDPMQQAVVAGTMANDAWNATGATLAAAAAAAAAARAAGAVPGAVVAQATQPKPWQVVAKALGQAGSPAGKLPPTLPPPPKPSIQSPASPMKPGPTVPGAGRTPPRIAGATGIGGGFPCWWGPY